MAIRKEITHQDLLDAISRQNFEVGSRFYAKVTYIIDPNDFYIMPFPFIYNLAFLSKPGNLIQAEDVKENKVVIFKSENPDVNKYFKIELDDHIRGVIHHVDEDNKCQIFALDRGFIEQHVSVDRIFYPASDEALHTPGLVQNCELFSCAPIGPNFTNESIEAFKFYVGDEKLSVVISGKTVAKLKLVVYNSSPDDIATLLALSHYTYLSRTIHSDWNIMTENYPTEPKLAYQHIVLEVDEVVRVRVQSGTSLNSFYVTPMSAYKKYLQNRADFTKFCKSVPEIKVKDFKPGALAGVQDDDSFFYERAVILEITGQEKARVKLIDWGSEIEVPRSRIKALKTEFYLTAPAYALYCSADDGFVPWDNGLSNFLYKGYTLTIKVKKVGNGFDTPHIVLPAPYVSG